MLAAAAIALLLCATWLGSCKKSAPPVRTAAEPPEAAEQGRIAGANASGDNLSYRPERYPVSFIGFGIRIFDGKIQ